MVTDYRSPEAEPVAQFMALLQGYGVIRIIRIPLQATGRFTDYRFAVRRTDHTDARIRMIGLFDLLIRMNRLWITDDRLQITDPLKQSPWLNSWL
ncbi:MAG TPA: hypothetical protein PLK38_05820, partial [Methanoregulaceae archaeon]|nr:hypothetical protein [Methanoregulaceae archaeon]